MSDQVNSSRKSILWKIVAILFSVTILLFFFRHDLYTISAVKAKEHSEQHVYSLTGKGRDKFRLILTEGYVKFDLRVTEDPGFKLKLEVLENDGSSLRKGVVFETKVPDFSGTDSIYIDRTTKYLVKLRTMGKWDLEIK